LAQDSTGEAPRCPRGLFSSYSTAARLMATAQDTAPNPVRQVWAHNVMQEMHLLQMIIQQEKFTFAAIDTEFPGVVLKAPEGLDWWSAKWEEVRSNADNLRLIQFGLALSNEAGKPPPGCGVWQFNFSFDEDCDLCAKESIALLRSNGCDFRSHKQQGIDPYLFGELLVQSGLVLNENVKWISFHGGYDFAYLVKVLQGPGETLPPRIDDMLSLVELFFPKRCDIKYLLRDQYRGGLQGLAQQLRAPNSLAHQAGHDAILTRDVFFRLGVDKTRRAFDSRGEDFGRILGLGASTDGSTDPSATRSSVSPALWRHARAQWAETAAQLRLQREAWTPTSAYIAQPYGWSADAAWQPARTQGTTYWSPQPAQRHWRDGWGTESWGAGSHWGVMSQPSFSAGGELVY